MLDFLYETNRRDAILFGARWCGPQAFKPWERTLVAVYDKTEGGDGQTASVYCTAAPARFYDVVAHPGSNSVGEPQDGFKITFGSSQGELAALIAEAIAQGMLGIELTKEPA